MVDQNFASLAYCNCQRLAPREYLTALPIEIVPSLVLTRNTIMLQQHLIIQFPHYYLSCVCLCEVKNIRQFQTFSSKSGFMRGVCSQEVPNIVISLGNFWYFGEQVTEERCSQPEAQLYSIILSVVFGTGKREEKAMEHVIACISHFNNGK